MTLDEILSTPAVSTDPEPLISRTLLSGEAGTTLVERLVSGLRHRIDQRLLRPGSRLPSIRRCADRHGVSRFTVVEAYERLVALGYLESRRGSGFYVRERRAPTAPPIADPPPPALDVVWLVRAMFGICRRNGCPDRVCCRQTGWTALLLGRGLRGDDAGDGASLLGYGEPQGYAPLRKQLQVKLAEIEIAAAPGADRPHRWNHPSAGSDRPPVSAAGRCGAGGRSRLVSDVRHVRGARRPPHRRPRQGDGPDLAVLEQLLLEHRPPLYVTTSVLHNPTGTSLTSAKAFQVLRLAEQYGVLLVEDDIYADFCEAPAVRLAALDQLRRVIYVGSFPRPWPPICGSGSSPANGNWREHWPTASCWRR